MKYKGVLIFLSGIFLTLNFIVNPLVGATVWAATGIDVLDRERLQQRPAPLSQPKITIDEKGVPTGVQAGAKFTLASLNIGGSTVFTQQELLAPYAKYIGQQVSFGTMNSIIADITKRYREAGYLLSSAIIPPQEVDQHGAHMRLMVIEGRVSDIQYNGDERILERFKSYFSPIASRLLGQRPLSHNNFERHMLLMQDVPGVEISSRFAPGKGEGESILILDVQGDLVGGNVGWGNTGTESTGYGMFSAGVQLNSLPFIGAQTNINYSQANNNQRYYSWGITQSYQAYNGLTFKAAYAYSNSPEMDTEFARIFDYESNSYTFSFGLSYPVIRSRDMNLSLGLTYEQRDSDAFLLDDEFTHDRLRAVSFNANFDFSDSFGGVTQIIPTIYKGLNLFHASDKSFTASNSLAPADYWKFDLYISRDQNLGKGFSLFTAAELQLSSEPLFSYNKFSLGGSTFGRAYEPGIIEGDNAFAVSFEPRYTYYYEEVAVQFFAFVDWGSVWTNEKIVGIPTEESASSIGGGVRLWGHVGHEVLPDFNISAFVAFPMEVAGNNKADAPRFVLQAALYF